MSVRELPARSTPRELLTEKPAGQNEPLSELLTDQVGGPVPAGSAAGARAR
ncbi:hypothetical protein SAMN05421869_1244 [Nonomuraea jiangxiensis]|uniref:Uncharacterized protein n=1 Tax=Nonomuraea jiangxiensis TaxID=633440 RepID=A0A1G9IP21_9ACTN|nr:hypothetical protein SAMN05421869_1244 [Nonomuraea jiangxiensis]